MPNDIWETGHQRLHFSHRFCLFCECAKQYLLGLRQVSWTVACGPRLSLLGGPIALQCFVHISGKKPCNTKVVFNHFDCDAYVYVENPTFMNHFLGTPFTVNIPYL